MEENKNIETAMSDNIQPEASGQNNQTALNEQDALSDEPATAQDNTPFLEIKYLKQQKALTKEQAKDLAEKGMHYSAIKDKLDYLAANANTTPKQFLDSLIKENELKIEEQITAALGDSELGRNLTELYKENIRKTFNLSAQTEQENLQANTSLRIADEFLKMQQDFGDELNSISDIPESVLAAANNGMPLAYAYLLNKYLTDKSSKSQQAASNKAEQESVGPVSTNIPEDPMGEQFIKSLWGRQ